MAKNLVIVESPTKVKTIKKFLGSNYEVVASNGHVRDLPKSSLGFDAKNGYEPKYITIRGKGDILASLRKEVKKADKVYLATDPDREGEAISWHLCEALKLSDKNTYRITFNEITKNAVKEAIKNPREIDINLVDAQQARRMLDRMVGYRISPLLWAKVKRGLSAGRVQSVALRMIADREAEIDAFIPKEYWTINAQFALPGEKKLLSAAFYGTNDEKIVPGSKEEVDKILKELKGASYSVKSVKKSERTRKQPLPFTTSTLQQEASKSLNFSTQKTMRLAQQLYEGVEIKGQGTVGLITYLRTDSTRVSDDAAKAASSFIKEHYGEKYLSDGNNVKKDNKKIQDAHEAIRPTDINLTPSDVKNDLPRDLLRLYTLIWKRFTASRMASAVYESTAVTIEGGKYRFNVSAGKLVFDGFMSVYSDSDAEKEENNTLVKSIDEKTKLTFKDFDNEQHFTQPPAHYTEASLVRALEEQGIGRPSTYAPTISTILGRRYIAKEKKNIFMTETGEAVNKIMTEAFPTIVDLSFTANLETLLDKVEEGEVDWKTLIENFYPDLDEAVINAEKELESIEIADEESDVVCDKCGRKMVIKYGPYGKFLGCPGFPECRNTKPYLEKIGVSCPKCGKEVVIRRTKKGRIYYGCESNPECDFMVWQRPSGEKCPKCGNALLIKGNKLTCADEKCGYTVSAPKDKEK